MKPNTRRRQLLQWLGASSGLVAISGSAQAEPVDRDLFDDPVHKLVYQFNKADPECRPGIYGTRAVLSRCHAAQIRR